MPTSTADLGDKRRAATVPSVMAMISAERMKSVRTAPLILSRSNCHQVHRRVAHRLGQFGLVGFVLAAVQQRCASFSAPSKHRKAPPTISSGVTSQGAKALISQRRRHQDGLVEQRTLGHRPDHGQFAVGLHTGDLLRVERQVVAQHTGGLLGSEFAENGDIVQHAGDVVDKGKETAGGHARNRFPSQKVVLQCRCLQVRR
jgi:hypothetical protein